MGQMPAQKRHRSKQDYGTPPELVAAIERRFGTLTWDAAATADNTVVADRYFAEAEPDRLNAFDADWARAFTPRDLVFLNPPFGGIAMWWMPLVAFWTRRLPWLRVLVLTPGSVGSEWYQQHVNRRAMVLGLSPRLLFVGADDPYPKDCILSCFGFGVVGFDVWRYDGTELDLPARLVHPGQPGAPVANAPRTIPAAPRARRAVKALSPG